MSAITTSAPILGQFSYMRDPKVISDMRIIELLAGAIPKSQLKVIPAVRYLLEDGMHLLTVLWLQKKYLRHSVDSFTYFS
jgi:hypothetical protein